MAAKHGPPIKLDASAPSELLAGARQVIADEYAAMLMRLCARYGYERVVRRGLRRRWLKRYQTLGGMAAEHGLRPERRKR